MAMFNCHTQTLKGGRYISNMSDGKEGCTDIKFVSVILGKVGHLIIKNRKMVEKLG